VAAGIFETLSEKDQRRHTAMQARQLGHGGIMYVSEILGCSTSFTDGDFNPKAFLSLP